VGDLPDSSLVSLRLADNRRLCVATPRYLQLHGTPGHPDDLVRFDCLALSSDASQTRGWAFRVPIFRGEGRTLRGPAASGDAFEVVYLKPGGPLDCSDGQVLHDWCMAGFGIAWRSSWEVDAEVASGRLVTVLEAFAAPPNGIYAVVPQRKHLPLRVRLWIDFLRQHYGRPGYWQA
jgi:DNA-binding transcriptional LysR family regulator